MIQQTDLPIPRTASADAPLHESPTARRRASPLRADFIKTALAALIPMVLFAVAVIFYEERRSREALEDTLMDASRRLTEAIDADLRQQLRTLSALAVSTDLDAPANFRGFDEEVRRISDQHPGWFAVSLVEAASLRAIFNTARPFGEALPPVGLPEDYADVRRSRRPLIAGRLGQPGAVIREPFIALRVPVIQADEVRYVLSAALSLRAVQALMEEQLDRELPRLTRRTAGAAIMDADGRFVARLTEPEKFAGSFASEHTRDNMRRGPGVYPGRTVEGRGTYGAYSQSALTGWTVVVGVDRQDADALVRGGLWALLGGGVVSVALAALLALQFGRDAARRRIAREHLLAVEADALLLQQATTSLAEKETLLREVHHRLKNNMQTIISLLRSSARHWPGEYQDTIRVAVRRMIAMVNVHEQLYRSQDLGRLALAPYLRSIMRDVAMAEGAAQRRINFDVEAEDIRIDMNRALPIGLILTECLINIFKHAFPGGRSGSIAVSLAQQDGMIRLCVRDDGVGIPPAMRSTRTSLGHELIETLAEQIGGTASMRPLARGTEIVVVFPLVPNSRQESGKSLPGADRAG
jgi:two-component sensor histidine kinase